MPAALAIKPSPVGGQAALHDYLRREAAAFEPEPNAPRLSGTVRLQIVVGADGKVSSLKVVRGLRADYDAEALRMVCDGPAWQPGVSGGRRAPLPVELTVSF
jgi:TonB family protein